MIALDGARRSVRDEAVEPLLSGNLRNLVRQSHRVWNAFLVVDVDARGRSRQCRDVDDRGLGLRGGCLKAVLARVRAELLPERLPSEATDDGNIQI